jgi:hypothetical protein
MQVAIQVYLVYCLRSLCVTKTPTCSSMRQYEYVKEGKAIRVTGRGDP